MAARPGPRSRSAVAAVRLDRASALAVLVLAATLTAACSGSPEATPFTGVTPESAGSGSPSGDSGSAPAETGGQQDGRSDNGGSAVATEGEGDAAAPEPATDRGTTGATPGTAEVGESEGTASEQAAAEAGGAEAAGSGPATAEVGESAGTGSGPAAAEVGASVGSHREPDFWRDASEGHIEVDPSEIGAFVSGPFAPLTGSLTTDLTLAGRRPLAVKVGNGDPKDRPQAGLAAADIVYEVLVEAGFTRFLAVFHSDLPSRIGPVRSARSSDFDILEDLSTPYLATSGANSVVRREMRQAARAGTLIDVGAASMAAPYSRDRSRPAPHNLYLHYENLGGGDFESLPGGPPDAPPVALFEYDSPNPPGLADAAGVNLAYTTLFGGESSHVWDPILGGWVRIQDGTLHMAETDFGLAEIAPANVVVLQMPYGTSAADRRSPQALSYGSGDALVLTAGSVYAASWERTEDRIGYRFRDSAGNPLSLSSGSTWLLLANTSRRWPLAEVTVLTASESVQLLADARAAAAAEANALSAS